MQADHVYPPAQRLKGLSQGIEDFGGPVGFRDQVVDVGLRTSGELEEAALNLGAGRMRAVRTIILPLITANLIAGGLLAFSFAMLEVSDSLILAQRAQHFPITKAIYVLFHRLGDGPYIASAMGVWAMLLLAFTLVGASALMGRKLGAVFRA